MKQLVQSLVISRLDYCNGTLAGLPMRLLSHLERVQNATTTLGLQPRNHIQPALFKLHWLPVHLRIQYKLCLLIHSVTVQCCPSDISNIVHNTAASSRRHRLRSSTDNLSYTVPLTRTKLREQEHVLTITGPTFGTHYHMTFAKSQTLIHLSVIHIFT